MDFVSSTLFSARCAARSANIFPPDHVFCIVDGVWRSGVLQGWMTPENLPQLTHLDRPVDGAANEKSSKWWFGNSPLQTPNRYLGPPGWVGLQPQVITIVHQQHARLLTVCRQGKPDGWHLRALPTSADPKSVDLVCEPPLPDSTTQLICHPLGGRRVCILTNTECWVLLLPNFSRDRPDSTTKFRYSLHERRATFFQAQAT